MDRKLSPRRFEPFNGTARQQDGLTVFVADRNGQTRALVRSDMPLKEALREICVQVESWPGDWRVTCI